MADATPELAEDAGVGTAFDLSGRVAVLTGAASGIGRSSAYVLASAGASVILGDINGPGVAETAKEVERRGGKAEAVEMDVTRRADVDALVERAVSDYGRIDIMGNIAGVPSYGPVVDITDEEYDRVLDINQRGVFYGCRAAMRAMIPQGFGNIVNVASGIIDSGGAPNWATYGMTKAAVTILTKTVATEGGPHNIRANAIAPGTVLTGFSRHNFVDDAGEVVPERYDAFIEGASKRTPLQRIGLPSDIAWLVLYLVSDASIFVTGQIMRSNGGTAMPW
jgi:3-oxoacyl-[acyl-carrier protein] reductase